MVRVSDRIVDVVCKIKSVDWDNVCLDKKWNVVSGHSMSYDWRISRCLLWVVFDG